MKNKIILVLFFYVIICNAQNKIIEFEYSYDQEKVNAAGQREGELIYTYGDNVAYKHIYKDGKIIEATNYRLAIDGLQSLVGKYKDGKPFEGYFVYANELEIPLIDYFENGNFIAQYTCSLLDLMQYEDQIKNVKWIKTIYKNNKPFEGLIHKEEFKLGETHLLASEYYENGAVANVDLWLMAVHYVELIKIKFESDGYTVYKEKIPSGGDPEIDSRPRSISVNFKDAKSGSLIFKVDNKIISKYQFNCADVSQEIKKVAGNISYVFNDTMFSYVQRFDFETSNDFYKTEYGHNQNIISQVYTVMSNTVIPYFTATGNNDYSLILKLDDRFNTNSILYLGENGNPFRGFLIEKETQSDRYKYVQYLDYKIVANRSMVPINQIQKLMIDKE